MTRKKVRLALKRGRAKGKQSKLREKACSPRSVPPYRGGTQGAQDAPTFSTRAVEPGGARFFLLFDVVGTPAPTPRPRSATGRKGVYVPKTAHEWKRAVRAQATRELAQQHLATQLLGRAHCLGALRVDVLFRMPRPKAHWRTGQHVGMLKTSAPVFHTSKPDKDNLEKAVLDALGEFDGDPPLVWVDDAQVVDGRTTKRYTRMGEDPGATVAIYELQR